MVDGPRVTLRARLDGPRNRYADAHLRRAVRHPAVLAPDVHAALLARGLPIPAARPGDPLLLAATPERGSLWTIARPDDPHPRDLLDAARNAWRVAGRVAARTLPVLADPAALLDREPPRLAVLSADGDAPVLDGASFGLPFFLAHLSAAAGVPVDADLAASAEVTPEGAVLPVDRLGRKLDAVRAWAPGVRRVLVAEAQIAEARAAAGGLEVIGVAHVREAIAAAFGEAFEAAVFARWAADPEAARQAADTFFRFVLREPRAALRWAGVQRALDHLRTGADGPARWKAEVAHAVAGRHAGAPLPVPPPPDGLTLRRADRIALLAHRVQAHNDATADGWEGLAREAEDALAADGDACQHDFKLLGALGRLHAGWGRFDAARGFLRRAVAGWMDTDELPEASYPLCELVRVAGLSGDAAALDDAERLVRRCLADPRTTDHARTFLQLALGRAHATLGHAEAARAAFADGAAPWTEGYGHVRASRLRWLARVDPDGPHLARLEALVAEDDEAAFALHLARADAGDAAALDALAPDDARQMGRCRRVADGSLPRALDLFPY